MSQKNFEFWSNHVLESIEKARSEKRSLYSCKYLIDLIEKVKSKQKIHLTKNELIEFMYDINAHSYYTINHIQLNSAIIYISELCL